MANSEDSLLMRELEVIIEVGADKTAQRIIDDILQLAESLKNRWPDAVIRQTVDREGEYVQSEIHRINRTLRECNEQFVLLYNLQLETSSSIVRPNIGNPPD